MEASGYTTLSRQSGLMSQMEVIAHNIANISTTGFRREGVIFSEFVQDVANGPSISMAFGDTRAIDLNPAGLEQTGGRYDFALQGDGFFQVAGPQGPLLTRAGAFTPSATGLLMTSDGMALLDEGGTPVVVPSGATHVALGEDGTLSADGVPVARIGIVMPDDPNSLTHQKGTLFSAGPVQPLAHPVVLQGYLEGSNVDPVWEISRMIAVQRAYEMGQNFLDREDERARSVIQTLGK